MGGWRRLHAAWRRWSSAPAASAALLEDVLARFPYTEAARHEFRTRITFVVADPTSVRGGGYWQPDRRLVYLFTAQYEAAIHELAHAWWHDRRLGQEDRMIEVTRTLAHEADPRYARMAGLARGYIEGIPEQGWPGMLVDRNDWEMYAGLASGMMADLRQVPPYVRPLYAEMFALLPEDAPVPATVAPHG